MIPEFRIKHFRLFRDVHVKGLSWVNLLVGKNNVGKSAFLEAIHLYRSGAEPTVILKQLQRRGEQVLVDVGEATPHLDPWRSLSVLFYQRKWPEILDKSIFLEVEDTSVHMLITDNYKGEKVHFLNLSPYRYERLDFGDSPPWIMARVFRNGEPLFRRLFSLTESYSLYQVPRNADLSDIAYLPAMLERDSRELALWWDALSLTPMADDVIDGLRLIDPDIEKLNFIESRVPGGTNGRAPFVRHRLSDEPIPLRSLGDGMGRLLQIMLGLCQSKGGILLIDEFENGLHWSVQTKIWSLVFALAARLEVQVFATTHSRDCVRAFQEVWHENKTLASFHRLERHNDEIRAVSYNEETLEDSIDVDVEVR